MCHDFYGSPLGTHHAIFGSGVPWLYGSPLGTHHTTFGSDVPWLLWKPINISWNPWFSGIRDISAKSLIIIYVQEEQTLCHWGSLNCQISCQALPSLCQWYWCQTQRAWRQWPQWPGSRCWSVSVSVHKLFNITQPLSPMCYGTVWEGLSTLLTILRTHHIISWLLSWVINSACKTHTISITNGCKS